MAKKTAITSNEWKTMTFFWTIKIGRYVQIKEIIVFILILTSELKNTMLSNSLSKQLTVLLKTIV